MTTPLKRLLEQKDLGYAAVARQVGCSTPHLFNVANSTANASPELAEKITTLFPGEITEMEVLYPERYLTQ